MISTRDFVYLHLPKTGGTFVTDVLTRVGKKVPEFQVTSYRGKKHSGIRQIPEEHRGKPIALNIRDPFDHLVSRYEFGWWKDHTERWDRDALMARYPAYPDLSFSEFLRLIHDWSLYTSISSKMKQFMTEKDIGYNTRTLTPFLFVNRHKSIRSLDDWSDERIEKMRAKRRFLHQERLNQDLYDLLSSCGLPEEVCALATEAPKIYPRLGGGKRKARAFDYFTPEERRQVVHRDRFIFRLFPHYLPDPADLEDRPQEEQARAS